MQKCTFSDKLTTIKNPFLKQKEKTNEQRKSEKTNL